MKYIITFLSSILFVIQSNAQFSVGINGGTSTSHTDATPDQTKMMYGINLQFQPANFIGLKLNVAMGNLEGGDASNPNAMHYTNSFLQADLNLKLYPVGILPLAQKETYLYYLSKIYGSIGIGMMKNKTDIHFLSNYDNFEYMQNYKGNDLVIPLELGIDIPLNKPFIENGLYLSLYYRINYLQTDKMDGYKPKFASNQNNDTYTNFGFGISYRF